MLQEKIAIDEVSDYFSPLFLDYVNGKATINDFIDYTPTVEGFKHKINDHALSGNKRKLLSECLENQYQKVKPKKEVASNIEALKDKNTFTVTTGHQPVIFTGPSYFIFKIITTINLARSLKQHYPEYQFVPVFWMASEDHDVEEINHFHLFNKTFTWETDQKGPVGRFTTDGMDAIFEQLRDELPVLKDAYLNAPNLSEATRQILNEWFGNEGLVVLDSDDKKLKQEVISLFKEEILNRPTYSLINSRSEKLKESGYEKQVNPREINLFYIENGFRSRIVKENDQFKVKDSDYSFNEKEINSLLDNNPEKISPNVTLRPLFQETVLPNLAYIGGPGEIAYWLQLKDVFHHFDLKMPVLFPRFFGMVINKNNSKKINKLPLHYKEYFKDFETIKNEYLETVSDGLELDEEREVLNTILSSIKHKAMRAEKSLEGFVGSESKKIYKSVHDIEKRIKRSEEKKQEVSLKQIETVKNKLFPDNKLQERVENILNYWLNDPELITKLLEFADPFDFNFNVLFESEIYSEEYA